MESKLKLLTLFIFLYFIYFFILKEFAPSRICISLKMHPDESELPISDHFISIRIINSNWRVLEE